MNDNGKERPPSYINKDKLKDVDVEKPDFDVTFQAGLLKMALNDDFFCSQLCRYLGEDKDLEQHLVFDNAELHWLFEVILQSMNQAKTRPSVGAIRQQILEFAEDEREPYQSALNMILDSDIHDAEFYRNYLTEYIMYVKIAKGLKKAKSTFKNRGQPKATVNVMQKIVDDVQRVHFEKEDVLGLSDVFDLVQKDSSISSKIPTGLTKLDEIMRGGFPRETLVTVLGSSNAGKSIFCTSLGCSALRNNYKVLHINLEGTRDEVVYRYLSNLADLPFYKIEEQLLNNDELDRINLAIQEFDGSLKIRNMLNFGVTLEDVMSYCRETYKEFPFDVVIVDYGQLLKTKEKFEKGTDRQTEVYRGLDKISKEFRCVVISPAQSTREGIRKQNDFGSQSKFGNKSDKLPILRSADLADCIEIARVSAIIITLNRTEDEEKKGWVRVFLEKQRRGPKAVTFGVKANYPNSNLITNDYYEPDAIMHKLDEPAKDEENAEDNIKKFVEEKKDVFSSKTKSPDENKGSGE